MQFLFMILLSAAPQWNLDTSLSFVYGASQASDGGVWCASSGGAFHYSPEQGMGAVYSCPEHLPVPDCRDVLEDSDGRLWFATGGGGLVMFDGSQWLTYSSFEGIPGEGTVTSLIEASGEIWAGCLGGVAHGGAQGFTPVGEAFTANDVYSISERGDTLWFATDKGIYTLTDLENPLNPASWTHHEETRLLDLTKVVTGLSSVYACGKSGAMKLAPGDSLFRYLIDYSAVDDSMVTGIIELNGELYASIHGLVIRKDGERWVSAGSGLNQWRWPVSLFGIQDDLYTSVSYQTSIIDIENTQSGMGLFRLDQQGYWSFIAIDGIQCKKLHQMAPAADGRIYVGSYSRGLQAFYPQGGWRSYSEEDGMPNTFQTFCTALSTLDGVWVSSYHHGLSWLRDNDDIESEGDTILTFVRDTLEYHSPQATIIPADIPNNQPVFITSQSGGNWAAFRQYDPLGQPDEPSGIMGFNGNPMGTMNWAPRTGGSGIAAINVRSVCPVSSDSLWIAFDDGQGCQLLVHSGNPADDSEDSWYPGSGQAYTTTSGLPSADVHCFLDAPGIGLLAGTSSGLARWTGSGFSSYSSIAEQVKALSMDSAGRIWCLAESGVYSLSDGDLSYFNGLNSDYSPSALYIWEYSATDPVSGGVYFSSEEGLWLVTQAGGGGGGGGQGAVSFYPQPFVSGEDILRLTGPPEGYPVRVAFFRLDGSHAGTIEAGSVSEWTWDGSLRDRIVASGTYLVLVEVNGESFEAAVSVVR